MTCLPAFGNAMAASGHASCPTSRLPYREIAVITLTNARRIAMSLGAALCLTAAVHAASPAAPDAAFMKEAALDGQFDIQSSRLAERLGKSDAVKKYAAQMVDDNRRIENALKKLAMDKKVALPVGPGDAHHAVLKKLSAQKGDAFDRAYMDQAGPKRQAASLKQFQQAASQAKDKDVRAFAQDMVPVLTEHHTRAVETAATLNK